MKIESDLYGLVMNKDFTVNMEDLIKRVKNRRKFDEIKNYLDEERKKNHDEYHIICGHDVTDILGLSFMNTKKDGFGYGDNRYSKAKEIEVCLRAIYDIQKFKNTDLYKTIVSWENKNHIKVIEHEVLDDII